jgi:putative membrane protein
MTAPMERKEYVLVLCVDRDGDIGAKAHLKTPIIGREENINAAVAFALSDPEEPDANAMFEAIRVFDRLKEETKPHESFQIATISGSELGDVSADRKLVAELTEVLNDFKASEVVLVTDGYQDEMVLPLIESRIPVSSVRRIVIRHSKSIEETAAVFTRYLKKLMDDPHYSRPLLGLPGLLLIVLGILTVYGLLGFTWIAFLLVLGTALLVKGFGVDKSARSFVKWLREYEPPPIPVQISGFATAAGLLSVAIGVYLGFSEASRGLTAFPAIGDLPVVVGKFISEATILIVIGVCVLLSGRAIKWYFERDPRLLRTAVIIAVVAWSSQILIQTSQILTSNPPESAATKIPGLAVGIMVGILTGIATLLVAFLVHRRYTTFFKKKGVEVEEFKEEP